MKNQICTILGGGGFIGRYLVRNLTKKNYRCIVTTRKAFQKGYLKTQATPGAIELIDWNPSNFSELKEAIKNSDVVINLIGILYENRKQKFYNIHTNIPEAVAKICSESDVKKFIHVSAIGASENSKSLYQKSKFQGEVRALENFKNTVVIRPSVVCGTEDNFTNLFSKLSILPVIPVVGINYKFQPILVNDVADAIVHAIELKGNEGKIYEIGGPKIISFGDMVKSILKSINKKRLLFSLPLPLAKINARLFQLMPKPLITLDQLKLLKYDNIKSKNYKTNFDLKMEANKKFDDEISRYSFNWTSGGQFSKKKNDKLD